MLVTLAAPVSSELLIKKSRFIGCVEPLSGREEALTRVAELRRQHPDARHVCWALRAGGHTAANDDGEPNGTAGKPMFEVLRHHELEGVLATVVRYFGGVKLGAGGLVRAYTAAVAQALIGAERVALIPTRMLRVTVPYALEGAVLREIDAHGAVRGAVSRGENVSVECDVPDDRADALIARINDASQGRAVWM